MRKSNMVIGGLAVAAAVATGSAFTASNTISVVDPSAGYGQTTVTGVAVTDIKYTPRTNDATYLDTVTITSSGLDAGKQAAKLTLKSSGGAVVGNVYSCSIDSATTITCDTSAGNVLFTSFSTVGLTVTHS